MYIPNRFHLFFLFSVFFFPIVVKKAKGAIIQEPDGVDAEEGEADKFYNKTYTEHQTALEKQIFRGYQVRRRPIKNESQSIQVDVHWHIIHVSINPSEQTMTVHGHLYMKWFDEYLVWDPKDFNGLSTARCKKWQVWQPKIKVANSASGINSAYEFASNAHVLVQMQDKDKSKVEMYPTFSIKVGCSFDFSDFPNDVNKCALNIFPTSPMTEIQLKNYYSIPPTLSFSWGDEKKKRIISDFLITNVSNDQLFYAGGNVSNLAPFSENELAYTWSMLQTTVTFQRHSPLFLAAIALPSVVSSLLNVLSFLIPSLTFACYTLMSNMFIQFIFLQDVMTKMPLTVNRIPDSVKLYSFIMIANSMSLFLHFFFIYLSNLPEKPPQSVRFVYTIKEFLPDAWTAKEVEVPVAEDSWARWLRMVRPLIALVLGFVYFIQILVFVIF